MRGFMSSPGPAKSYSDKDSDYVRQLIQFLVQPVVTKQNPPCSEKNDDWINFCQYPVVMSTTIE